jgi:molybdate transport system substrate-binding protein
MLRSLTSLMLLLCCGGIAAGQITVAAAADLNAALPELAVEYQKEGGNSVKLAFGSSGSLFSQIQNGAPFDMFFSADADYPRQLVEAGLAERSSLYRYAVGKLVVWVPASSSLDLEQSGIKILRDPSVKKIAIANPQHAPYGRAAEAALRHFGIYEQVAPRLVLGENVSQAAQFVESGSAQAGLIALSHALSPSLKGKGRYWIIPPDAYPPLNQSAVILARSSRKQEAADFLAFLKTRRPIEVLKRYGFAIPEEH